MEIRELKRRLSLGDKIVFQTGSQFIVLGGAGKDIRDNYRQSPHCNTIEECLCYIGACDGYSQERLESNLKSWKYILSL